MIRESFLLDEDATVAAGRALGEAVSDLRRGAVVYLQGTLGAGKTTFCRGVLAGFGHSGAVKSPTYTLVEPYEFPEITVYHFDLYRLGDPEELEFLGIRDYFDNGNLALIEWPEKGLGGIPASDLVVDITAAASGRKLRLDAGTELGVEVLSSLQK